MDYIETLLKNLVEKGSSAAIKILIGLVIIVVGFKLIKWMLKTLKKGRGYKRLDPSLATFLNSFTGIALRVLVLITAAAEMGLPVTSFITLLASAGVAIGLALQGGLSNLAGGVMLLLFHPFKIGDYIQTAQGEGTVTGISVFYTHILTIDNRHITLPNGSLTAEAITNYSSEDKRRVDIVLSVGYDSDIEKVKKTVLEAISGVDGALPDPVPFCRLSKMGESALEFTIRVWCPTQKYWDVYFDINEAVKKALDDAGISIPYPQLDVHLNTLESNVK